MKLTALALLACLLLPATANAEEHGPPPTVGSEVLLTPRFVCADATALQLIFSDGKDLATVRNNIAAISSIYVNGKPLCLGTMAFKKPVTILGFTEVGGVIVDDGSEFKAWDVHAKFSDGEEIHALWLEMTTVAPVRCDRDCA